ncbi:hypothetical protein BH23ACT10_BH23ACT10_16250 [soil metagenome]
MRPCMAGDAVGDVLEGLDDGVDVLVGEPVGGGGQAECGG